MNKEKIFKMICNIVVSISKLFPLSNLIVFESNPDFADNTYPVYNLLLEKGYNRKYKFVWILNSSKQDRQLPKNVFQIQRFSGSVIEKIRAIWVIARAKYIIDSNRYIHKSRDSQIRIHLKHGLPMKDASTYNQAIGKVDVITVPSEYWVDISSKEHSINKKYIKPLGFPRNDVLKKKIHNEKNIIWMPTYRNCVGVDNGFDFNQLMPFGLPFIDSEKTLNFLNDYLNSLDVVLYVRLHPAQNINGIHIDNYSNIRLCDNEFLRRKNLALYDFLGYTDALITDYSSVYYDYLLLDNPIAVALQDFEEYSKNNGIIYDNLEGFKEAYPAYFINSFDDLIRFVEEISKNIDSTMQERLVAKEKYQGSVNMNATEKVVDYIIKKFGI